MRSVPIVAAVFLLVLAGCATQPVDEAGLPSLHPSPIVVHELAFSPGVVTLDPTLGYSLSRGVPGVPPRQRADALGRAAAFNLADAMSRELRQYGYDVVGGDDGSPQPRERALIVSGDFRHIDEGRRHEGAGVAAGIAIDYVSGGAPPQRLISFDLDSRRLPREGVLPAAGPHGEDVNYEATRLGAAIGQYVAELAQTEHWPRR
jgi:hypothetical protein